MSRSTRDTPLHPLNWSRKKPSSLDPVTKRRCICIASHLLKHGLAMVNQTLFLEEIPLEDHSIGCPTRIRRDDPPIGNAMVFGLFSHHLFIAKSLFLMSRIKPVVFHCEKPFRWVQPPYRHCLMVLEKLSTLVWAAVSFSNSSSGGWVFLEMWSR